MHNAETHTHTQTYTDIHSYTYKPTKLKPHIKPLCVTFIEFWSNLANENFLTCMGNS